MSISSHMSCTNSSIFVSSEAPTRTKATANLPRSHLFCQARRNRYCRPVFPAGLPFRTIPHQVLPHPQDDALLAYQVAFDLFENEFQQFLLNVRDRLPDPRGHAEAGPAPAEGAEAATETTAAETTGAEAAPKAKDEAMAMDEDAGAPQAAAQTIEGLGDLPIATYAERMTRLKGVLSGETPINLALQFLYSRNRADLLVLKNVKAAVDVRNSVCHGAIIYANGLMHAGTTVDTFLRENLEWLSRSTNWAKFSATAGLGVIHRGHLQQGRALMAPYLPQNGVSGSPYSEGGALYALGLIHANHGESIKTFLLESLRNTTNEIIQHGAALGLGLAALGTANEEIFEDLKSVLFTDSANAGEAAGIGMGLLMVGSASEKAGEMLAYAHETQHEKIIRWAGGPVDGRPVLSQLAALAWF
jgi:26S proteasome regulatory subunit N2